MKDGDIWMTKEERIRHLSTPLGTRLFKLRHRRVGGSGTTVQIPLEFWSNAKSSKK